MQFMAERIAAGANAQTVLAELAERYKTVSMKKRSNILQSAVRQVMQQKQKTGKQVVAEHVAEIMKADGVTNCVATNPKTR